MGRTINVPDLNGLSVFFLKIFQQRSSTKLLEIRSLLILKKHTEPKNVNETHYSKLPLIRDCFSLCRTLLFSVDKFQLCVRPVSNK